jgi:hypothetical protein
MNHVLKPLRLYRFEAITNPADPTFEQLLGINNSGLTTRTGAGVFNHATVASRPGGTLSERTSQLPTSITPATTDRACTSSPTQLHSFITGASRNSGSTAGPLPTATRANLRASRRALHTVWR